MSNCPESSNLSHAASFNGDCSSMVEHSFSGSTPDSPDSGHGEHWIKKGGILVRLPATTPYTVLACPSGQVFMPFR